MIISLGSLEFCTAEVLSVEQFVFSVEKNILRFRGGLISNFQLLLKKNLFSRKPYGLHCEVYLQCSRKRECQRNLNTIEQFIFVNKFFRRSTISIHREKYRIWKNIYLQVLHIPLCKSAPYLPWLIYCSRILL